MKHLQSFVRVLACALVITALAGCTPHVASPQPAPAASTSLHLQRMVMLMRHGVRPPTRPYVIPAGYARQPWPTWQVPAGHLTAHGYQGAVLLGRWDRAMLAAHDVLPASGCPEPGSVLIWADTDQRTRATGEGFAQGLAPGCGIAVGHADGDRNDPLFSPVEMAAVAYDPARAKAAVMQRVDGDLANAVAPLAPQFARLDAILDCCSLPLCTASGLPAGCDLAEIPHVWEELQPRTRVDFVGPFSVGGTASESILLEYVNGKPMAKVGWGRASPEDIVALSAIHAAEFDLLARTPYIANRASTPIMQRVLKVFANEDAPRLTVLVGHDTNIANVAGMLDLHWHVPGYAADDPAVNGTVGFALLSDASGRQFVRVFYQAQGALQLRKLQPLNKAHPPYFAYLPQPLCGQAPDRSVCGAEDFTRTVRDRLAD